MSEDFIGEIRMFAVPPGGAGWLPCDGRSLPLQSPYTMLYALIGTTYGGDGKTFFKLPDLRGRAVIGCGTDPGDRLGVQGGTEMVALSAAQLPAHTHEVRFVAGKGTASTPLNSLPATAMPDVTGVTGALYAFPQNNSVTTTLTPETVGPSGSGAPHSNLQPSFVIGYYIAYYGAYPSRGSEEEGGGKRRSRTLTGKRLPLWRLRPPQKLRPCSAGKNASRPPCRSKPIWARSGSLPVRRTAFPTAG